jgi:hypothetical protein
MTDLHLKQVLLVEEQNDGGIHEPENNKLS